MIASQSPSRTRRRAKLALTAGLAIFLVSAASSTLPFPAAYFPVEGLVLDEHGNPLAEATIRVSQLSPQYERFEALLTGEDLPAPMAVATTDDAGRYELSVPTGVFHLEVSAPGRLRLARHLFPVAGPVVVPPALLGRSTEARIEIFDSEGVPIPGTPVVLVPSSGDNNAALWESFLQAGWSAPERFGRTGSDGIFRDDRLTGELLDVHAWPGIRDHPFSVRTVEGVRLLLEPTPFRVVDLRIVDSGGSPAAGVIVGVGNIPWPAAVSDFRGEAQVTVGATSRLPLLLLTSDGRLQRAEIPPLGELGPEALELRLGEPLKVRGRVVAEEGPLPGALVWTNAGPGFHAVTGPDGRFELPATPAGWVRSAAPGYRVEDDSWTQESSPGFVELQMIRKRAHGATGRVVDLSEAPLAQAMVSVRPASSAPWKRPSDTGTPWQVVTDGSGKFLFPRLPGETIDVWTSAPGHSPMVVRGIDVGELEIQHRKSSDDFMGSGSGMVFDLGMFLLERSHVLRGHVAGPDGRPVADASLWILEHRARRSVPSPEDLDAKKPATRTDSAGYFEASGLTAGSRIDLVARRSGYSSAVARAIDIPRESPLELTLSEAADIVGHVKDPDGLPVEDARVELWPEDPGTGVVGARALDEGDARHSTSGPDGQFRLEDVRPGAYRLQASADDWAPADPVALVLTAEDEPDEQVLTLRPGAILSGWTRTSEGEPVADVEVTLATARTESDDEGRYRLTGLPLGPDLLEAWHPIFGRTSGEVEIRAGEEPFDIEFEAVVEVEGRVVDPRGEAIEGADVRLSAEGWRDLRILEAKSDPRGRFEFPQVARGPYSVHLTKAGFVAAEPAEGVEVGAGGVENLLLEMWPEAEVRGHLLNLEPAELAGASIQARRGELHRTGRVAFDGRYVVEGLSPGDWLLVANTSRGERQANKLVQVAPGADLVGKDIRFEAGLQVKGTVTARGQPLEGAILSLRGLDLTAERQIWTDHDGRFGLRDLEPGRYLLAISDARRGLSFHREFSLTSDRQMQIEIATSAVDGLVASDGEPVSDALVQLRSLLGFGTASMTTVATGQDGSFRIERLTAGTYGVTVSKSGFGAEEDLVEVPAEGTLSDLVYELQRDAGLELRVVGSKGAVPKWAGITLLTTDGRVRSVQQKSLTPSGWATFDSLPPGEFEILVWAPKLAATRVVLRTPREPREVVLREAGNVRLRVESLWSPSSLGWAELVGADGRRFEGVDTSSGAPITQWRVEAGRSLIEGVPEGSWQLTVTSRDGNTWSRTFSVAAGSEETVRFD